MKPKILFFLMNGVGGAERITITLSSYFDLEKYDLKYVLVQKGDDEIRKFLLKDIPVISIPCKYIYMSSWYIYRLLRKERPQIVFCASPAINARLIIAARLSGKIRVVVRNSNMYNFERCDVQWLMRHTYQRADKIILQQDEMREDLHKHIPKLSRKKTIALQNPIDIFRINDGIKAGNPYNSDKTAINYLWVARFANEKAQDFLVQAFEIVHRKQPMAHLWLVGHYNTKDEYTKKVLDFIKKSDAYDYIHVVGHDSNPYRWMRYCDCFVLPSRFEGLPNALIEAMYLGRPVVATRCLKVIGDMVREGENGYTCDVGNIDELATLMLNAIKLKNCKMTYQPARQEDFIKAIVG